MLVKNYSSLSLGKKQQQKAGAICAIFSLFFLSITNIAGADAVTPTTCTPEAWINEFHYDNDGGDVGEFVEIVAPIGTDLTGYQVVLYNGNGGSLYNTLPLSAGSVTTTTSYTFIALNAPGIQNGSPDGIALVNGAGVLVQFLSYEGTFTAVGGPADGIMSVEVKDAAGNPVAETGSNPMGSSLSLVGDGSCYNEFTWALTSTDSPGDPNTGQTGLGMPPPPPPVSCQLVEQVQNAAMEGDFVRVCNVVVTRVGTDGYYVQEPMATTISGVSSAIFVFTDDAPEVAVGDVLEVTGTFEKQSGLGVLESPAATVISSNAALPDAVTVTFPQADLDDLFAFQSMIVKVEAAPDSGIFVSEYFEFARYGEFLLCAAPDSQGRLFQYTQFATPDVDGFEAYEDLVTRSCFRVDDGSTFQNPDPLLLGGVLKFDTAHPIRGGTEVQASGVLTFRSSNPSASDPPPTTWRVIPITAEDLVFEDRLFGRENLELETLGRYEVRVVTVNVLNFFTSLDINFNTVYRGADGELEFIRQAEKLLSGLCEMDADVYALIEIENTITNAAVYDLVRRLNEECVKDDDDGRRLRKGGKSGGKGSKSSKSKKSGGDRLYTAVSIEETILKTGTDQIKVELVYDSNVLDLVGSAILDDAVLENSIGGQSILDATFEGVIFGCDPCKDGSSRQGRSRAPLAGTFQVKKDRYITVAVNHYKSKGFSGVSSASPDDDQGDGAGNWNALRTQTSEALLFWLDTYPTGVETDNIAIVGDLNSYAKEPPIDVLINAGYISVEDLNSDPPPYGYVFSGQWGTLDYIFMSPELSTKLVEFQTWFVNADETPAIDYNIDFGRPQDIFDGSVPWRHSDHDPIIATFNLDKESGKSKKEDRCYDH